MSNAVHLNDQVQFLLPPSLLGRPDVSRLLREVEALDYELETQAIRTPDKPLAIPNMTKALTETAQVNKLDVVDQGSRKQLITQLRAVKEKAPIVHMVFAVDPDPSVTVYLAAWIRQNLHPTALLTVGLQPRIVGGCVIRTPDHLYDFSLRKQFSDQTSQLVAEIKAVVGA